MGKDRCHPTIVVQKGPLPKSKGTTNHSAEWKGACTRSGIVTPTPEVKIMMGERELTKGLLAKDASFRLIVTGNVGVKEIERLIQKLEIDKEILADQDDEEPESAP